MSTSVPSFAERQPDQQFSTLASMLEAAQFDKLHSAQRAYNLKDLSVVATPDGSIRLASPRGTAAFTNWSFGQGNRMIGAPAKYVGTLPADLIARCMNYGISQTTAGTTANLLVRANGGEPIVRSINSETYGRLWQADLLSGVQETIGRLNGDWRMESGYTSDRDSFLTLSTRHAVIHDPTVKDRNLEDIMYRAITIKNSEVGASRVVIDSGIYRPLCGNMALWALIWGSAFRRRHVGSNVLRDVLREIFSIAYKLTTASAERDQAILRALIDHEIAHTKEGVIDELRKIGATKEQAEMAYARCELTESVSPRSFWGIAQGLTRVSQDSGFQDERFALDQLAAVVMKRGATLVAA